MKQLANPKAVEVQAVSPNKEKSGPSPFGKSSTAICFRGEFLVVDQNGEIFAWRDAKWAKILPVKLATEIMGWPRTLAGVVACGDERIVLVLGNGTAFGFDGSGLKPLAKGNATFGKNRSGFQLCFDPVRGRLLLWGGTKGISEFDPASFETLFLVDGKWIAGPEAKGLIGEPHENLLFFDHGLGQAVILGDDGKTAILDGENWQVHQVKGDVSLRLRRDSTLLASDKFTGETLIESFRKVYRFDLSGCKVIGELTPPRGKGNMNVPGAYLPDVRQYHYADPTSGAKVRNYVDLGPLFGLAAALGERTLVVGSRRLEKSAPVPVSKSVPAAGPLKESKKSKASDKQPAEISKAQKAIAAKFAKFMGGVCEIEAEGDLDSVRLTALVFDWFDLDEDIKEIFANYAVGQDDPSSGSFALPFAVVPEAGALKKVRKALDAGGKKGLAKALFHALSEQPDFILALEVFSGEVQKAESGSFSELSPSLKGLKVIALKSKSGKKSR